MAKSGPGKSQREGISFKKLLEMFPNDKVAEKWLQDRFWEGTPYCPRCGSTNVRMKTTHPHMPHRCREKGCRKFFSIRTGTCMEASKVSFQCWAIAFYLYNTNLKGISSMRLHRELDVTQKTSWFMLHRIREAANNEPAKFVGPVEVDETLLGPSVPKMNRKSRAGHEGLYGKGGTGGTGKTIVAGIIDKPTKQTQYAVLPDNKGETLKEFVMDRTVAGAEVHTDEAKGYKGLDDMDRVHKTVNHSEGEYARKEPDGKRITTNSMEANFGGLRAVIQGVYHHISTPHLPSCLNEKAGRGNLRLLDTIDQMAETARAMRGRRLTYKDPKLRTIRCKEAFEARMQAIDARMAAISTKDRTDDSIPF